MYYATSDDITDNLDEEANGYAYKAIYGALRPKVIVHQTSGKFCQTTFFLKDTNISDNEFSYAGCYLCHQDDKWHVKKIHMNTEKKISLSKGGGVDSLILGIKYLEQEETKFKKEGYQEIVSEQDLGNSHYKTFLKERGAKIQDGVLNTPLRSQGHVVEKGCFFMNDFNHKATPFKIEEHITTLLDEMVDMAIFKKFTSMDESIPESLTPLYKEYLKECDGVQELMQELKSRQGYIKALGQGNCDVEGIYKHLRKPWEKTHFHNGHNRCYMEAEFEALQRHTECDWSKIPSVRETLYKRMNVLRKLYNETKDARKTYLEMIKEATPVRPPLPEYVMM